MAQSAAHNERSTEGYQRTQSRGLAQGSRAIKVAIDILKSARVPVPVQLRLACHVLHYCLRHG